MYLENVSSRWDKCFLHKGSIYRLIRISYNSDAEYSGSFVCIGKVDRRWMPGRIVILGSTLIELGYSYILENVSVDDTEQPLMMLLTENDLKYIHKDFKLVSPRELDDKLSSMIISIDYDKAATVLISSTLSISNHTAILLLDWIAVKLSDPTFNYDDNNGIVYDSDHYYTTQGQIDQFMLKLDVICRFDQVMISEFVSDVFNIIPAIGMYHPLVTEILDTIPDAIKAVDGLRTKIRTNEQSYQNIQKLTILTTNTERI